MTRIIFPLVIIALVVAWAVITTLRTKNPSAIPQQIGSALKSGSEKATATAKAIVEETKSVVGPVEDPHITSHIAVYFAPGSQLAPGDIDDAFIAFLRSANKTLDCAFYQLQFEPAAEALVAQKQRGVRVRIVTDSDYKDEDALARCTAAGIPVVFDNRKPFMHDKFCIVDGMSLWTGSTNATDNCLYKNDNNSIQINSQDLAAEYTAEFERMFVQKKFGARSPRNATHHDVDVDGVQITCLFSPEDGVLKQFLPEIKSANATIDVLAFSFTLNELSRAMANRLQDGVRVRGVFESKQASNRASEDEFLTNHGATIHLDKNPAFMHDKVIIVDGQTVITGSYNFSANAENDNDENMLILRSSALAERYTKRFEILYN